MIDPGLLGSVGPIVAATGVGLLIRRGLAVREQHVAERATTAAPTPTRAAAPTARPSVRPAVPAGQAARR
jgi:hypothetical protein